MIFHIEGKLIVQQLTRGCSKSEKNEESAIAKFHDKILINFPEFEILMQENSKEQQNLIVMLGRLCYGLLSRLENVVEVSINFFINLFKIINPKVIDNEIKIKEIDILFKKI